MRGTKAKQLRRLTEEHTKGLPLCMFHKITTHAVKVQDGVDPLTGLTHFRTEQVVNPFRMVNDCTRRQYQLNKRFYGRMRRGQAVFHA